MGSRQTIFGIQVGLGGVDLVRIAELRRLCYEVLELCPERHAEVKAKLEQLLRLVLTPSKTTIKSAD